MHHDFDVKLAVGQETVKLGISQVTYKQLQRRVIHIFMTAGVVPMIRGPWIAIRLADRTTGVRCLHLVAEQSLVLPLFETEYGSSSSPSALPGHSEGCGMRGMCW